MDKNRLDGLLALSLVAEKRNFTAAAEALGISPPAISKLVKQLERKLGVTLLSRTTRSTHLTEAGERFLAQAGPALDQILSAMDNVGRFAERPSGLLRINLPRSVYWELSPHIMSFMKKYPDVTVELFFDDGLSDIVEGGFDAGIRLSEMMAKDMVALKLFGPIRWVTVASPRYFKQRGRPKHPKDLLEHNCIRPRIEQTELYDQWEFESKGKDFQVHVTGSLILNDPILSLDAVLAGAGIAYLAEDMVRSEIESGKLETVLDDFVATSAGYYLYFPKRSQALPKLRAFVDHLKTEFGVRSRLPLK
ncbi:MAG: LysR substrate-binding domain-containing protein [Oligoflexia bacterium]|nr:LysR substrate-binding domain-containing protein [Oligoflexia bacterium]